MDRLIKGHFRDVLAMPRAPYPRLEMSSRMTSSAGRCYPDSGSIKLATLYHRDHGIDATLLVLKHELAHWAARWRYGRRIAPHGREFRAVAHELDPRITITCPPFAQKERAQRRGWHMTCPQLPPTLCAKPPRQGRLPLVLRHLRRRQLRSPLPPRRYVACGVTSPSSSTSMA